MVPDAHNAEVGLRSVCARIFVRIIILLLTPQILTVVESTTVKMMMRGDSYGIFTAWGSRTGHFVKVSLWYASLLTNTRFRFVYFRINHC